MGVPQYTTPTFTLTFSEKTLDLTQADHVYVTFKGNGFTLTKSDDLVIEAKSIGVHLAQNETARFSGTVEIQANWTISGNRIASEVTTINITKQLLQEVVE